jgi:hypothetical protein
VKIERYTDAVGADWDQFLTKSLQGNFLHSRRFLSYHGDRFRDCSLVLRNDAGAICGLFPAAYAPNSDDLVISHVGSTYGGLVVSPICKPMMLDQMLKAILDYYRAQGVSRLRWKSVPEHLNQALSGQEGWVLFRNGFQQIATSLWNLVDLTQPRALSKRRRKLLRDIAGQGVSVQDGVATDLAGFHALLVETLAERHDTAPVHSLAELRDLWQRFPKDISLLKVVNSDGVLLGGVLLFHLVPWCTHSQYIASSAAGREISALKPLLETAIAQAQDRNERVFSFGASTEGDGRDLNETLFDFKHGFGGQTALQSVYENVL